MKQNEYTINVDISIIGNDVKDAIDRLNKILLGSKNATTRWWIGNITETSFIKKGN